MARHTRPLGTPMMAELVEVEAQAKMTPLERKQKERIKELEAHTPTQWAYDAACKALAHWRKEARRLGRIAGQAPREMKKTKS